MTDGKPGESDHGALPAPSLEAQDVGVKTAVPAELGPAMAHATTQRQQRRARFASLMKSAAALSVVAVVPLFIIFANTQLKDLVEQFTGGCVFVLEKRMSTAGQILVTGRIAGTMPKSIPLMFEGRDALINTIVFDEPYRQEQIPEPDDLAFHPMTGLICPGALCPESGEEATRRQVQIVLRDLRPEFTYRFRTRMQNETGALSATSLKVYALFDAGLQDGVCRIQPRRWFNFWVWATPLQKAMLFLSIVVVGGLLLRWSKFSGGE
jgi:hypothetical protein